MSARLAKRQMAADIPVRINVFRSDEELSGKAGKGKVSVSSSDKPGYSSQATKTRHTSRNLSSSCVVFLSDR